LVHLVLQILVVPVDQAEADFLQVPQHNPLVLRAGVAGPAEQLMVVPDRAEVVAAQVFQGSLAYLPLYQIEDMVDTGTYTVSMAPGALM
jgi:hypothetical protein